MTGIILAAGNGIRFRDSVKEDYCKVLSKINGRYLIEFTLGNLILLGVKKAVIVTGRYGEKIKDLIGDSYKGIDISYANQPVQKGLINAFCEALPFVDEDEDVILQLADEIFSGFSEENINAFLADKSYDFCCGVTYEKNPEKIKSNYSVKTDADMRIEACTEKPHSLFNNLKGTGLCIFRSNTVEELKKQYNEETNSPDNLCDYMNLLIENSYKGLCVPIAEKEFNINTSENLQEAIGYFSKES